MTVLDARTGQQLGQVPDLNAAQIGPDGTLVAANDVGEITEYDLDAMRPLRGFPDVRGLVNSGGLRFDKAGTTLMARSFDRTVSIYDIATRTRSATRSHSTST